MENEAMIGNMYNIELIKCKKMRCMLIRSVRCNPCQHPCTDQGALTGSESAGAHLAFLRSCNTVAFLQEGKYIFLGWIFTFTYVWRTTKNPLIYLS